MKKLRFLIIFAILVAMVSSFSVSAYAETPNAMINSRASYSSVYSFLNPYTGNTVRVPYGTICARGSSGDYVEVIQHTLFAYGEAHDNLAYHPGDIDGLYGSQTYNAVYNYQNAVGVSADGVVGSQTWPRLENHSAMYIGVPNR